MKDVIATDRPPQRAWPMFRALVGVGVGCTLLIVGVFLVTLPAVERNRAEMLQRAIFRVLPGAVSYGTFDVGTPVYAGFDDQGNLLGLALEAKGMGYQDTIQILYGYDPERQTIIGMQVLASKETPGLGDKIEKDPVFLENFTALDVRLNEQGDALLNPIELVKPGKKTASWQIDSISGATISSTAIAKMLAVSSAEWVPVVYRRRQEFMPVVEGGDES